MRTSDQQYHALVTRSGGHSRRVSSQLLSAQDEQYLSRKRYGDREDDRDPYTTLGSLLERSAIPYSAPNRGADNYADSLQMRAQLAADRREGLLPSPTLADYSPTPFREHIVSRGVLAGRPISPEVVGSRYAGRYPSPQGAGRQPLSNADLRFPSPQGAGRQPLSNADLRYPSPQEAGRQPLSNADLRFPSPQGAGRQPHSNADLRFPSPQGAGRQPLSNADLRFPSPQRAGRQPHSNADLLAARARRSRIAAASCPGGGFENDLRRMPSASAYDDPGVLLGRQTAGILGPGVARNGRDLDRYLLAVQPEKRVRYAAPVLAPEPALRRNSYPFGGISLNPEDDRYSNYRRAKARRTGSFEFGRSGEPGSQQRGRERDIYREREHYLERGGRGQSGRERGKRSPDRRPRNGSLNRRNNNSNRADRLINNASQSSEGKRGQRNGGKNKRSRPSEKADEPKEKVGNDPKSDDDSELGSLCAALSDSVGEKVEKKSEDSDTVIDDPLAGMIFGCSSATFHECMRLGLFGLPAKSKDDVMRVTPGTKVFLFNFDTKELSGIFEAVSRGGWQIQPDAFEDFGGFPAQVHVRCTEKCPNIAQSLFKPAIKENYVNQSRFRFDLNTRQVRDLVRMFREAARNQDPEESYVSARLRSEGYSARGGGGGGRRQRPYRLRHPQARLGTSRVVPHETVVLSMPAKTTRIRKSKRESKRALRRSKKRKVILNRPESPTPMADDCSLYSLSGEIQEPGDVAVNASRCDDDASNENNDVVIREGIETGKIKNVDKCKEIVETPPPAKGISPSGPELPQPQRDLGELIKSVLEDDGHNDGTFRMAGSRADEQGQKQGLDLLQGPLSRGNVIIKSSYVSTLSSIVEEPCPSRVLGDSSTTEPAVSLVTLGGNHVQELASSTGGDRQLSDLDERTRREGLGGIGVPAHQSNHADLGTCESISIELDTGGTLPDIHRNGELITALEDQADCKLPIVGKNDELELIANAIAIGSEDRRLIEKVVVAPGVVGNDAELAAVRDGMTEVIAEEVAIDVAGPGVSKEAMTATGAVGKDLGQDEEIEMVASEVAVYSEDVSVREGVTNLDGHGGKHDKIELIVDKVAVESEAPCVRNETAIAAGVVGKDAKLGAITIADVAVDSEAPFDRRAGGQDVVTDVGTGGRKKESEVIAPNVDIDFEARFQDKEEIIIVDGAGGKDEELEAIVGEQAIDSKVVDLREEVTIAAQSESTSQFLPSAATDEKVSVHDYLDQGDEIIFAADVEDNEQQSPNLNVMHGDKEDEEEVLVTNNAKDSELVTSADEDDDEGDDEVKEEDYNYDEGDCDGEDEDDETVDVSVDGELSNLGEDDIGEGEDGDDGSWSGQDE